MKNYLVTGATQGLGLEIAKALAKDANNKVLLAVRDLDRGKRAAADIGNNAEAMLLDLSNLDDVARFIKGWNEPLSGLINNAGVQITNETRMTANNFEETTAVNHLAAFALMQGLLQYLNGGRVLLIGSGTHNPNNRTATIFGFRGPRFTSVKALAKGGMEANSSRQIGMDRYATSKFLNMVTTVEFARRYPQDQTAFICLDPGLMPGTGLARSAPAIVRFMWSTMLRWVAPLLPDTSTPRKSGEAAAWIMTTDEKNIRSGEIYDYNRQPSKRVWHQVYDQTLGKRVYDETLLLLSQREFSGQEY
jgi:NAD(P)-dependent dehydrogenase (short-subunit alcohol dehydrogenase family)